LSKATTDNLKKHILRECKGVPADVRKYWLDEFSSKQASSTAGEQAVIAGVKRKVLRNPAKRVPQPAEAQVAPRCTLDIVETSNK
jgi:hypothetical protein